MLPDLKGFIQTSLNPTITLIPTATVTPIPARDTDLLPTFETLMSADYEDCQLPCWWTLKPGETTIDEAAAFLSRNGFDRHWKDSIYSKLSLKKYISGEGLPLYFLENSYFGEFLISFGFDAANRIRSMRLGFNNPGEWLPVNADVISPAKIVAQFEDTPEVYIAENPSTFRLSEYNLILLYRSRGTEIHYIFDVSHDNLERPLKNLNLCLDLKHTTSVEFSLSSSALDDKQYPEFFKTPQNAFGVGISTEEFVQFFKDHADECLDISQYKFPNAKRPTPISQNSMPTPIPTAMVTPIPARDLDLLPTFEKLMEGNYENCTLPCWWGLTPGKTTLEEIVDFTKTTGFDRQWKLSSYSASLTLERYLKFGERIVLDFLPTYYLDFVH